MGFLMSLGTVAGLVSVVAITILIGGLPGLGTGFGLYFLFLFPWGAYAKPEAGD